MLEEISEPLDVLGRITGWEIERYFPQSPEDHSIRRGNLRLEPQTRGILDFHADYPATSGHRQGRQEVIRLREIGPGHWRRVSLELAKELGLPVVSGEVLLLYRGEAMMGGERGYGQSQNTALALFLKSHEQEELCRVLAEDWQSQGLLQQVSPQELIEAVLEQIPLVEAKGMTEEPVVVEKKAQEKGPKAKKERQPMPEVRHYLINGRAEQDWYYVNQNIPENEWRIDFMAAALDGHQAARDKGGPALKIAQQVGPTFLSHLLQLKGMKLEQAVVQASRLTDESLCRSYPYDGGAVGAIVLRVNGRKLGIVVGDPTFKIRHKGRVYTPNELEPSRFDPVVAQAKGIVPTETWGDAELKRRGHLENVPRMVWLPDDCEIIIGSDPVWENFYGEEEQLLGDLLNQASVQETAEKIALETRRREDARFQRANEAYMFGERPTKPVEQDDIVVLVVK